MGVKNEQAKDEISNFENLSLFLLLLNFEKMRRNIFSSQKVWDTSSEESAFSTEI